MEVVIRISGVVEGQRVGDPARKENLVAEKPIYFLYAERHLLAKEGGLLKKARASETDCIKNFAIHGMLAFERRTCNERQ